MKRIALYHLETLLWISRLGTFAAAAERLNTTQPAISARVRELESQLRFPLFQRAGRKMALTVRGRQFVKECEPLWASIEQTLLRSGSLEGASGIIRIGTGEIAAATCLPGFLTELSKELPRVNFDIEIDLSHGLLQKLLNATSDLIFLAGPVVSPNVETAPIGSVELIWAASPPIAAAPDFTAGSTPLWLLHHHSPIHDIALASLSGAGLTSLTLNSCNNVRALIDILLAQGGIGFVPETMVREHLHRGTLVEIRPEMRRSIAFQAAIRTQETDPLVRSVFDRAKTMQIGHSGTPAAVTRL
jgi:DNA-binding transcriptional LysR family regulator